MDFEKNDNNVMKQPRKAFNKKWLLLLLPLLLLTAGLATYIARTNTPEQRAISLAINFIGALENGNHVQMARCSLDVSVAEYIRRYSGVTILDFTLHDSFNLPRNLAFTRTRQELDRGGTWHIHSSAGNRYINTPTGTFRIISETDDVFIIRSTKQSDFFTIRFMVEYATRTGVSRTNTIAVMVAEDRNGELRAYDFLGLLN